MQRFPTRFWAESTVAHRSLADAPIHALRQQGRMQAARERDAEESGGGEGGVDRGERGRAERQGRDDAEQRPSLAQPGEKAHRGQRRERFGCERRRLPEAELGGGDAVCVQPRLLEK
jgi:hypothetical protein